MSLDNLVRNAGRWVNDRIQPYTPVMSRPRHLLNAGLMVGFLYFFSGCGGSSGGGGNGTPANKPPVVSATFNPVSLPEDTSTSVSIAGHFSDPDKDDTLSYSVSGCNLAALNGSKIDITPAPDYNGSQTCTVKACDPHNACVTTTLDVEVTPVNDAPVIDDIVITTANELFPLAGYVTFHDIDSPTVTCSGTSTLPQPINVAPDGTISSGNLDRDIAGNYSVTVPCSDGSLSGSKTETFDVRDVTNPGRITNLIPTATTGNVEQIELNWTGTGDDGTQGKPQKYLLRFSDAEIVTVEQWDTAAALPDVAAQWDSGVWYSQLFANIPPGHFCFAVRAVDEVTNIGEVSNSPCADVISRAQYYVDFWLPIGSIFLNYTEAVNMIQGNATDNIPSYVSPIAAELIRCNPAFPGTQTDLENDLLALTNGNPADSELHQGFDPWNHDNDGVGNPGVRLYFAPDGTSGWDFSNLPNTPPNDAVTNLRDVMREFLIQYVDFHQADYGNLCTDAPACNPTWATQD